MKRQRTVSIMVVMIIVAAAAVAVMVQYRQQNARVRHDFNNFFAAIEQYDLRIVRQPYQVELLDSKYEEQLVKYKLLGWKITKITGQPFPMDVPQIGAGGQAVYNELHAMLYYDLPDTLRAPKGAYRRITHPKIGACAVVPVKLEFAYHGAMVKQLVMPPPGLATDKNWTAPFEKLQHELFH